MANDQTMRLKSKLANSNVGKSSSSLKKKQDKNQTFSPMMVFLFLFLVVGSSVFQILSMMGKSGGQLL